MKRFLSLIALVAIPALSWAADVAQQTSCSGMDKMKCCMFGGPVCPKDECWAARTDAGVHFGKLPGHLVTKGRSFTLYTLNTLQPLYRTDDMHNTVLAFGGIGTANWGKTSLNAGVGYRYLTDCMSNIFGVGVSYHHMDIREVRFHGPRAYVEWLSQYTTLTLNGAWDKMHVKEHAYRHFLREHRRMSSTSLDLSFQLPYLPWTQVLLGRTWFGEKVGRKSFHHYRHTSLKKLDYGLRFNLLGCLALEGGYLGGWTSNPYVRLVLSFGRPASNEYTLADGFLGNEAFTARDLKSYTLAPVMRNRLDTIAQIK